jgi:glycosyltransferase involved in cell wall biosynthesis
MRIALVSQEYPPETAKGGIGSQTFVKAHGLAALGHDVIVISQSTDGERRERCERDVRVIRIPGYYHRMDLHTEVAEWITYSSEVAAAIADIHARSPLDIVDFPEWGGEGYVHLLNRTERNHIPTVIQLHGPLVMFAHTLGWPAVDSEFYRVGTTIEGTCLRLADAVFSSSACSADWCARHYGLDRSRIPLLHTGVDTGLFRPRAVAKSRRPTVIFVGKIARNKGVGILLDACCSLAHEIPDLQVRMLGRGEPGPIDELRARSSSNGSAGLLDLAGFVARDELPDHLSRAHVFAAPSVYEGGPGFVYLEAMACGLPVIACEGSGAAEVVRPGENGLLVPPGDVASLIAALRRLLLNSEEREAMGANARNFVLESADSKQSLNRLESFYQTVVAGAECRNACC